MEKSEKIDFFKYGFLRLAVASPEVKPADVRFNLSKIKDICLLPELISADIILFPELSITAYTCADLFFQKQLREAALDAILELAELSTKTHSAIIVGLPIESNGRLYNCAGVLHNGKVKGIVPKTYLCNQSEYYEERWFSSDRDRVEETVYIKGCEIPFGADLLFDINGINASFGIEICEDLWSVCPPSFDLALAGANVILNLSASNEYLGKLKYRKDLVTSQSSRCLAAYIYSSSGPGESTTDTVFSGHCIIAEYGRILSETERFSFQSQYAISDIDIDSINTLRTMNNSFGGSAPKKRYRRISIELKNGLKDHLLREYSSSPFVPQNKLERDDVCREIIGIQTTALAKRLIHTGIEDIVLGISGGLDSTLALLICTSVFDKLEKSDKKRIHCISMPGFGTTKRTYDNAKKLCNFLGVNFKEIDIKQAVRLHFQDIGHSEYELDITYENSQARERTQILMDYANKVGGLVIGTGDLSEIALGWSTYNADHMSMYNVNSGVPKTLIRYIIKWFEEKCSNQSVASVLKDIGNTPISPELLPPDDNDEITQLTESQVGNYELNDFFLYHFLRYGVTAQKMIFIAEKAFEKKYSFANIHESLNLFVKRFFDNQFKRSCMPDGVKVGTVSLSPRADWRMPSDAISDLWSIHD